MKRFLRLLFFSVSITCLSLDSQLQAHQPSIFKYNISPEMVTKLKDGTIALSIYLGLISIRYLFQSNSISSVSLCH